MRHPLLHAVASSLLLLGCAGSGTGTVHYSASAQVTTPEMVYIDEDVQVVADYHEPVFYTDNYYWRYDNGVWYRSDNHVRGWVRVEVVPPRIRRIDRPQVYVRYRGRGDVRGRGPVVRDHRTRTPPTGSPVVRDHRDHVPPPVHGGPTVRDPGPGTTHGTGHDPAHVGGSATVGAGVGATVTTPPQRDVRDARQDARRDVRDARQDGRDDRRDAKQDAKRDVRDARQDAREDVRDARKDFKEERKDADSRKDVRDARKDFEEERKEAREEVREERKEAREDVRDARKDARKDVKEEKREGRKDVRDARKGR